VLNGLGSGFSYTNGVIPFPENNLASYLQLFSNFVTSFSPMYPDTSGKNAITKFPKNPRSFANLFSGNGIT